ncbi:MAG: M35 family metallo-endopeptidase [Pseudomonadota bacterium]
MAMKLFSKEYDYIKGTMKNAKFRSPAKKHLNDLKHIMTVQGFDPTAGPKLDLLRECLKDDEPDRILKSAGINPGKNSAPNGNKLMDAAVIKFLRHTYLIHERGAQKVWVFATPKSYRNYPSDEIWGVHSKIADVKDRLKPGTERFSKIQRKRLGEATVNGMKHVQKAKIALIMAALFPEGEHRAKVKRWFADANTSEEDINKAIKTLYAGFSKVGNTLNSNHVIFTDMPTIRGATAGTDDAGFEAAYAFVYSGRHEKMPIIYIENAFFAKNSTPIGQSTLWALTVVHEVTHLDCSTKDHRYDYAGLQVGQNLSHAQAVDNADSWAYFAADCACELTDNQCTKALRGW